MAEVATLVRSLEKLRFSERYSDLTIECKGKIFKVHRAIVCAQSKVLAAMIDSNWKEAATGKINLEDDDPNMVVKMIEFLYGAQYGNDCGVDGDSVEGVQDDSWRSASTTSANAKDDPRSAQEPEGLLITHAQLYILGDKYDIPSLKELSCRNYKKTVETEWRSKAFPESAEIIYNNIVAGKDALKDVIYETARINISILVNEPGFESLLRRTNDLATDILVSFIQKGTRLETPRPTTRVLRRGRFAVSDSEDS